MPETSMEFICCVGSFIITIQGISADTLLSTISLMLNVDVILFRHVGKPFQSHVGLLDFREVTFRR